MSVILFEHPLEAIETIVPGRATLAHPAIDGRERARLHAINADAPALARAHQTSLLQHLEVLHHRWQGHGQRLAELADGGGPAAQPLDHAEARWIGQGVKDAIEARARRAHAAPARKRAGIASR